MSTATTDPEYIKAGLKAVMLINKHSELLRLHLAVTNSNLSGTLEKFMMQLQTISEELSKNAHNAEDQLMATSLTPDRGTIKLIESVQTTVDQVIEQAQQSGEGARPPDFHAKSRSAREDDSDNRLRRFAGRYSKHVEAIADIEQDTQNTILSMIGSLSRDDVLKQRLQNIEKIIHGLTISLSYLVIDLKNRMTPARQQQFFDDLLVHTLNTFTSTREREIFYRYFPEYKAKKSG